jgi:transcriptional regulator
MANPRPLLKGTLDVLVLKALTFGPRHGFEIAAWLDDRSVGVFTVDDGALYYALHRMEERGLIDSEWGLTDTSRRARYYRLRPAGRAYLRTEGEHLARYARALTAVLAAGTA